MPSYADNLKTAMEYANTMRQEQESKPKDVLDIDDGFTLNAQIKKARQILKS